jgi:hypothetical protein
MTMVMEMNNIADWSGSDSTFVVPAGYVVKDGNAMLKNPPQHAPKPPHQ